jgi:membrane fusion protein, multidrug efflux system
MGPQADDVPASSNGFSRSGSEEPPRPSQRTRPDLRSAMFVLIPVGIIGGIMVYLGGETVSADQAHISTRYVSISAEVAGQVSGVNVVNNQRVTKGQILYRLDPRPFDIVLDEAETDLLQIAIKLASQKKNYDQSMGAIAIEEAMVLVDQASTDRYTLASNSDEIARQEYERSRYELQSDLAELSALRREARMVPAKVNGKPGTPVTERPQYREAEARLHEAQRALDETIVRAPFSGTVSGIPGFFMGKYLAPYAIAFYLVDTNKVWVDATPKATDLTRVLPGQAATINVPGYPALTWHGVVESVSKVSFGSRITGDHSAQAMQLASVRVCVDTSDPKLPPLGPEMAAKVEVNISQPHHLPKFVARLFKAQS